MCTVTSIISVSTRRFMESANRLVLSIMTAAVGDDESIAEAKGLLDIGSFLDESAPIAKLMIAGATRIGVNIAKLLEREVDVSLVEPDPGWPRRRPPSSHREA